ARTGPASAAAGALQGAGSPARRGPSASGRLDGVAAELVPQRGGDFRRERLILSRGEARVERGADRRGGNAFVDRLEDRPAALARVVHVALDLLEVAPFLLERGVEQLEQPAAHDRAVAPDARDLVEVEVELGRVHHLE